MARLYRVYWADHVLTLLRCGIGLGHSREQDDILGTRPKGGDRRLELSEADE